MQKNIYKEGYTQNREISWLHFDDRVLNEAKDKNVPLLERMKSVYFYSSNLTEFFRVRVGSLYDLNKAKVKKADNKSGLTPQEQLNAIYKMAKRGTEKRDEIFADLKKQLTREGVEDIKISECTKNETAFLKKYYKHKVAPILAPQIVDSHHPFPALQNHITYIAAILQVRKHGVFCFVPIPLTLPEIIVLPHKKKIRYVHMEDLILANINSVFPDAKVTEITKLTVARSAVVDPEDEMFDEIVDYRKKMERVLKERKKMNVTVLAVSHNVSPYFRKYLLSHLKIGAKEFFVRTAPMNLKYVFGLENLLNDEQKSRLVYEPYTPKLYRGLDYRKNLFSQIQKKDVLLQYPYNSMEPFLQLVREAAGDPSTVSIRITIYRLARNARLVDYLCQAAENGKEVDVLIELKARFDEQNNIDYSERLEDAGCTVTYGFDKYKVHSKICLITKMQQGKPCYAVLLATGNFNESTAKTYTDLAYITSRTGIVKDAISFFNNMAIGKLDGTYHQLLVAPVSMKPTILSLMDGEIEKGKNGYIFAKVNSITDEEIIAKISEASCAGVRVDLLVRGISCILPGIPGRTDNVTVHSIVGRYLEHSRIYIFGTGKTEKMYISSADFMTRNTERRVEIACPIPDADTRRIIHGYISICMQDNTKARTLGKTGRYHKINDGELPFNSQNAMMRMVPASSIELPNAGSRNRTSVFNTRYKKKK